MGRTILKAGLLLSAGLASSSAMAQTTRAARETSHAAGPIQHGSEELGAAAHGMFQTPKEFFSRQNLTVAAGGGFTNFTEQGTDAVTGAGGNWTLRGIFGADQALALEGGYVGAAYPVTALNGDTGTVVSTGFEALGRIGYPIRRGMGFILPYFTTGLGTTIYTSAGLNSSTTGISGTDWVFNIPVGFGIGLGYERFSFDLRFIYRPAWGASMFDHANPGGVLATGDNTLSVGGLLGYRF
jgi:hypothetical protein